MVAFAHCEKTETAISAPELLRLPTRHRPSLRSKSQWGGESTAEASEASELCGCDSSAEFPKEAQS